MPTITDAIDLVRSGVRTKQADQAREEADTYQGDQEKFLEANEDETPEEFAARPKIWMNLTKSSIDLLSGLYREPPVRKFAEESDAWAQRLSEVYQLTSPIFFKRADSLCRLHGVSAIQPWYDRPARQIKLRLLARDNFEVITAYRQPTEPEFVVVLGFDDKPRWADIWDIETVTHLEQRADGKLLEVVSREPNPYGVLPFVFLHNDLPHDTFFTPGIGPNIVPQNWHINKLLTELSHGVIRRSWPQRWIRNADPLWRPIEGVKTYIRLEGDNGEVGQLDATIDAQNVWEGYIQPLIEWSLSSVGVPARVYRMSHVQANSGVQVIAEQLPLIEDRQERATLFGLKEVELARMILAILAIEERLAGPTDGELGLTVQYRRPGLPLPSLDKREWLQWQMDNGLMSPVDVWLELNPGHTREEAESTLEQNKTDNQRFGGLMQPIVPMQSGSGFVQDMEDAA